LMHSSSRAARSVVTDNAALLLIGFRQPRYPNRTGKHALAGGKGSAPGA
jgi:hypothetical protein